MTISEQIVGKSQAIKKVFNAVARVAPTDSTVLITGETGSGKEVMANAIHRLSKRADAPFVAINCSAIPENLLESELFGYKKGAFTGANADKRGLLEEANQGTLFLDEIGDMNLALQAKLLRVLDDGQVRRVGDTETKKVNVRIVAATNKNLRKEIEAGRFREDLFFRLNVVMLNVPPLRDRKEDIPALIRSFLEKYNNESGKDVLRISDEALAVLMNYDYPGNVRELQNTIKHAVVFSDNNMITKSSLPPSIPGQPLLSSGDSVRVETLIKGGKFIKISEIEEKLISETLSLTGNNHTVAARYLGISRSTLWRKMKEYGME